MSLALITTGLLAAGMTLAASAQNKVDNELDQATQIMHELTGPQSNAGIPDAVLKDAKCVAVIPKLFQGGFVVGARHGNGIATCKLSDGRWSAPAPFSLTGASFGAQIGGQEEGYVMMVMNHQGMRALESGHFKVGAGVSAAAGPVGRQASASGGWKAAILSYARSKGAYVGATVRGAELNQDKDATKELYGHEVPFTSILSGQVHATETAAREFVHTINHAVVRASTGA
ncbi:MAG: lipid-binding SYLF domain-containing protein [Acidobacteriaceae bacterium]